MSLNVLEFSSHCHHKKVLSYFLVKEVRKEEGAKESPVYNDSVCLFPSLKIVSKIILVLEYPGILIL